MSQLPLLVTDPAKQPWFWETAVVVTGIVLLLNVVLIAVVAVRHLRGLARRRRAEGVRMRFGPVLNALAAGQASLEEVRQLGELGGFEGPIAASMLLEGLRRHTPKERAATLETLREAGAIDRILQGTRRRRPWRRALAIRTLGWLGAHEGVPVALERLADNSRYVRDSSVRALGRIGDEEALVPLQKLYLDKNRNVAAGFAYEAVAAFGPSAAPVFRQGLLSPDEEIRVSSCFGIASVLGPEYCRPLLEQMLDDSSPAVRAAASKMLGGIGGGQVPEALTRASRDHQQSVRLAAVAALGSYDDAQSLELLLGALLDPDRHTAVRAGESLLRLTRLPRVGAEAREALERTDAWPAKRARTLASLGAL